MSFEEQRNREIGGKVVLSHKKVEVGVVKSNRKGGEALICWHDVSCELMAPELVPGFAGLGHKIPVAQRGSVTI